MMVMQLPGRILEPDDARRITTTMSFLPSPLTSTRTTHSRPQALSISCVSKGELSAGMVDADCQARKDCRADLRRNFSHDWCSI